MLHARRTRTACVLKAVVAGLAVSVGLLVVSMARHWEIAEMVAGLILLLLTAALIFVALLRSCWPLAR